MKLKTFAGRAAAAGAVLAALVLAALGLLLASRSFRRLKELHL